MFYRFPEYFIPYPYMFQVRYRALPGSLAFDQHGPVSVHVSRWVDGYPHICTPFIYERWIFQGSMVVCPL